MMTDFHNQLSIDNMLFELSQRGTFYCEKRLVFEFAKILEKRGFQIFLEYPTKEGYEDIRVETPFGIFVFEFKYCPSGILVKHGNLEKMTRKRSPSAKRLLDFKNDIKRTSGTVEKKEVAGGFCIFITNQQNLIATLEEEYFENYKWFNFKNEIKALVVCL